MASVNPYKHFGGQMLLYPHQCNGNNQVMLIVFEVYLTIIFQRFHPYNISGLHIAEIAGDGKLHFNIYRVIFLIKDDYGVLKSV